MDQKRTIQSMESENNRSLADYFQSSRPHIPLRMSKAVYKRFLEESGVVPELTKVLFKLYDEKEKPPYLIHYFRKYFGETDYEMPNIYRLRQELDKANILLKQLQDENDRLKKQLCSVENYWELKPFDYRY